jgi:hypothetical protein
MIIELPALPTKSGGKRYRMGFYHFSNNNLAVRTRCARELGMYDPRALTSEDVDLCFRLALSDHWVACREPGVVIRHKARRTLRGLIRQMWGWGIRLARPYAKTGYRGLYAYWVGPKTHTVDHHLEIDGLPLLCCAFFTDFHLAHALALAALLSWALGSGAVAAGLAILAAAVFWRHLGDVRRSGLPPLRMVGLAAVHYVANVTFLLAAFLGGLGQGMVLMPASILPPQGSAQF